MDLQRTIKDIEQELIHFRRILHMRPELSKQEFGTQERILLELKKYNISCQKVASTGVEAIINPYSNGKTIAIRADIDALPIEEENTLPYKSMNKGVMHACGHDVHTTIALGVARVLKQMEQELSGTVKIFFQPDEEVSAGAKRIVEEGHLEDVDYILGLHVMPYLEVGEVEVKYGALNASTCSVVIDVKGTSSHAAYPEQGIDPIVISGSLITAIQSIFTRRISPLEPAVLSFGTINGGTKANILASNVRLEGTLRTIHDTTKEFIKGQIKEICDGFAKANNTTIIPTFSDGYPPLINDDYVTKTIIENAEASKFIHTIHHKKAPSMGAEDFGYYQTKAKGAFFHLGCGNKEKGFTSPLHSSTFQVDEGCIPVGVELQVRNVLSMLEDK